MKILHITDSHATMKSPIGRQDQYYISFLKKLMEVAYVVKQEGIDCIVHTGDLFHTARVSNKFAGHVSEIIKGMNIPFYVVPGNHDIEGYSINTIDQTILGLLAKAGVVSLLTRDSPVSFVINDAFVVALSGQEYYANIDEGNISDFDMQQSLCDFNVLAIHSYISDVPQHPNIKHTLAKDIVTNADIILSGHYHQQFEYHDANADIYNPGSMMRVEQNDYNKTHIPQYGVLEIELTEDGDIQYDYKFHNFKSALPSIQIFDYQTKYQNKRQTITIDAFKDSLNNTVSQVSGNKNIIDVVSSICSQKNSAGKQIIPDDVYKKAMKILNESIASSPDTFEVKQGYCVDKTSKKIAKIQLNNFQSHENTIITLDKGLNVINGESNNGKTSILRAILWVIDNQPLGNDFIMAGKNECSVTIEFDDGSSITRARTRKDSGTYEVKSYDPNHVLDNVTYKGFANSVPVHVDNVHQMPKVNVTKDIETHLNVQSQLDPPFLLFESPQNKAAAIGRITGTHTIDAALKEINRQNRNLSIVIKENDKTLTELEDQLAALEDENIVHQLYVEYEYIYKTVSNMDNKIERIKFLLSNIDDLMSSIDVEQKRYDKNKNISLLRPTLDVACKASFTVQTLITDLSKIDTIRQSIEVQNRILSNAANYQTISSTVNQTVSLCDNVGYMLNKLTAISSLKREISSNERSLSVYTTAKYSLPTIIAKIKGVRFLYDDLTSFISQINIQRDKIKQEENAIDALKERIKYYREKIDNQTQTITYHIINYGLCPCCNQSVTNENVANHISHFMKGEF